MLAKYIFLFLFGLTLSGLINAVSPVQPETAARSSATGSKEKRLVPNAVEITQKSDKLSTQETEVIFQRWKKILRGLGASATGIQIGKNELVTGKIHKVYYEITYTDGPTPVNNKTAISQFDQSLTTDPIPAPGVTNPGLLLPVLDLTGGASADVMLD